MPATPIRSARQVAPDSRYDAVVIGSGIGSLAAAAVLAREGRAVAVLERHYTAGGFTHVFRRSGYEWDVGIHYIGAVNRPDSALARVFDYITDGALQWADMGPVYDRIVFGDEIFEFHKGREAFVAHLQQHFPEAVDRRAIEDYVGLLGQVSRSAGPFFAEKALPPIAARLVGARMRRGFERFARRTTRAVLEDLTSNEKLIGVLTGQFGDYGLPPRQSSFAMHAIVAHHYLGGGAFPVGGCARIAETIAAVIARSGGVVLTKAEVDEILVDGNKAVGVRLADGREVLAPVVISGAGVDNTYTRLVPRAVRERFGLGATAHTIAPSIGHLALYAGFQRSATDLGLGKANYWIYPAGRYDHDANIRAYIDDPQTELPLVYISFPSAKDPDWERRHPGTATVDLITLAPHAWFARWRDGRWRRRGAEYEALKERFAQRMLETLYRYEPQLRGQVDCYEVSTPLSTSHFANYPSGEIYGLEHSPLRFAQRFLRPATPVKNLWLTGQDVVTCGVGGAMMAGVLTVSAIRRRNYVKKIVGRSA